jgi:hypothetical protein
MMIGKPGTGKGTASYILKDILDHAQFVKFAPDRTTKEKFLLDLEQGFEFSHTSSSGTESKLDEYFTDQSILSGIIVGERLCSDVFILAEEFNDFLGSDNIDFISLLTKMWSYKGTYRQRIKTGRSVAIPSPCINLLGGNTHEGFSMAFPSKLLGQGFLARFILVHGSISNRSEIAFPDSPEAGDNADIKGQLGESLVEVQAKFVGAIPFTNTARLGAEQIIRNFRGPEDGRFENYAGRRFVNFLKLCICFAASEGKKEIGERTMIMANTLLYATEAEMPKALGEFGKSRHSEVSNKVMQYLYTAHMPVTVKQLFKLISNDLNKPSEMTDIIENLLKAEKIQWIDGERKGEGGYLAKQDVKLRASEQMGSKWVDVEYYNYLREIA